MKLTIIKRPCLCFSIKKNLLHFNHIKNIETNFSLNFIFRRANVSRRERKIQETVRRTLSKIRIPVSLLDQFILKQFANWFCHRSAELRSLQNSIKSTTANITDSTNTTPPPPQTHLHQQSLSPSNHHNVSPIPSYAQIPSPITSLPSSIIANNNNNSQKYSLPRYLSIHPQSADAHLYQSQHLLSPTDPCSPVNHMGGYLELIGMNNMPTDHDVKLEMREMLNSHHQSRSPSIEDNHHESGEHQYHELESHVAQRPSVVNVKLEWEGGEDRFNFVR